MATSALDKPYLSFKEGMVTESHPLTPIGNSCRDIVNLEIKQDGSVTKRLPLISGDINVAGTYFSSTENFLPSADYKNMFIWDTPLDSYPDCKIVFVQIRGGVYAYQTWDRENLDFVSIGGDASVYTADKRFIGSTTNPNPVRAPSYYYRTDDTPSSIPLINLGSLNNKVDFTTYRDFLVLVTEGGDPAIISYKQVGTTTVSGVTGNVPDIQLRVFYYDYYTRAQTFLNIDVKPQLDDRPTELTPEHEFNLRNSGWPLSYAHYIDVNGTYVGTAHDPIQWVYDQIGVYPSISDVFHRYKTDYVYDSANPDSSGAFSILEMDKNQIGSLYSPRGRLVEKTFHSSEDRISTLAINGADLGTEVITNNTFDSISNWTLSTDASISSGKLFLEGNSYSTAKQNITVNSTNLYQLSINVAEITSQTSSDYFYVIVGGVTLFKVSHDTLPDLLDTVFTVNFIPSSNNVELTIATDEQCFAELYDISIKPLNSIHPDSNPGLFIKEDSRPSCVVANSGRLFYSGVNSPDFVDTIFYSRVLDPLAGEPPRDAGYCFTEADPTAEVDNAVVTSDGGTLKLSETGGIFRLISVGASVVAFGSRGVWEISGADGNFFTATSQRIRKITGIAAVGPDCLAVVGGNVVYMADDAIYSLTADGTSGLLSATDISTERIDSYYRSIPLRGKREAKVTYDYRHKKVYFLYNDELNPVSYRLPRLSVLILDIVTGVYSRYIFADNSLSSGTIYQQAFPISFAFFDFLEIPDRTDRPDLLAFMMYSRWATDFHIRYDFHSFGGSTSNTKFLDYEGEYGGDGVIYDTYLKPQLETISTEGTATSAAKQYAPYDKRVQGIEMFFRRSEKNYDESQILVDGGEPLDNPSSCMMYYSWDGDDLVNLDYTKKGLENYSGGKETYRLYKPMVPEDGEYNYPSGIIQTTNRIKGRGNYLGLLFDVGLGKDVQLLGYDIRFKVGKRR